MSSYALANLIALIIAIGIGVMLWRYKRLSRTLKLSMVAPLLSFPWLYFGVNQKAWAHGDPGPLFMGVPINEVFSAFVMTFVNSGIFMVNYQVIIDEAHRSAEAEDRASQENENNPAC